MSETAPNPEVQSELQLQESLEKLIDLTDQLEPEGFTIARTLLTLEQLQSGMAFPLVRDGADGIRASYSPRRGLIVFFTNGFEDPSSPERIKVEALLDELGIHYPKIKREQV